MDSILAYMEEFDYENLYFCQEKETGLRAIIALHDTTLGPALVFGYRVAMHAAGKPVPAGRNR